jgi:hypothetical protein
MRRALIASVLLPLAGGACVQNAAFELHLDLPATPEGGPVHALTQVRIADENPFDPLVDWEGDDPEPLLLGPERTEEHVSVLAGRDDVNLHVKVRFCESERCDAIADAMAGEAWFRILHPFYVGHRTEWTGRIETVPTMRPALDTETEIDACDIRGCVKGGDTPSYCRLDGTHFCEGE